MLYKVWEWRGVIFIALLLWLVVDYGLDRFDKPTATQPVTQQEDKTCHFRQDAKTIHGYSLDMEVCQVGDNVVYETYYWNAKKVIEFKYTLKNGVFTVSIWENKKLIEKMTKNPVKKT